MLLLAAFGSVIFQPICSLALCSPTVRWLGWWSNSRLYLMLCALKQQPWSSRVLCGTTVEWWIAVGEWCWTFLGCSSPCALLLQGVIYGKWCLIVVSLFSDLSQDILIVSLLNVSILDIVLTWSYSYDFFFFFFKYTICRLRSGIYVIIIKSNSVLFYDTLT